MKKYVSGIIMAVFAFIAVLPLQTFAARTGEVRLEAEKNNAVDVSVSIPEAAGEAVSSLQLGLQITDQDGNSVNQEALDQIEDVSFVWSQEVQARAKITEQRYQREGGILRLYIAGTDPLFTGAGDERDTLALGTVTAAVKDGEEAGMMLYISMAPDSFKIVRGTEAVPVPAAAVDAELIVAGQTPDQPPAPGDDEEKPGDGDQKPGDDEEKPGDGDQKPGDGDDGKPGTSGDSSGKPGGSSDQQGADKSQLQEILNLAAGYEEADYTWESYSLLLQAIREAQAVLDDPYATQEDVDRAIQAIQNAVGSLVPATATSVDTMYGQNTLYGGQNQAVGTGDRITWEVYAAVMVFSAAVIAGAGIWKRNRKRT